MNSFVYIVKYKNQLDVTSLQKRNWKHGLNLPCNINLLCINIAWVKAVATGETGGANPPSSHNILEQKCFST